MTHQDTIHYATLIRLQVAMSALQQMIAADRRRDDHPDEWRSALRNAGTAIQIALGGCHDVPERLVEDWTSAAMKRDASRVLAETA